MANASSAPSVPKAGATSGFVASAEALLVVEEGVGASLAKKSFSDFDFEAPPALWGDFAGDFFSSAFLPGRSLRESRRDFPLPLTDLCGVLLKQETVTLGEGDL